MTQLYWQQEFENLIILQLTWFRKQKSTPETERCMFQVQFKLT